MPLSLDLPLLTGTGSDSIRKVKVVQKCLAMTVVKFSLSFRAASDTRVPVNNACWHTSRAALCRRTRGRQERSQSHRAAHFLSRLPFPGPKRPPGTQNPHNAKVATLTKRTFNCELKLPPRDKAPFVFTYYMAFLNVFNYVVYQNLPSLGVHRGCLVTGC